MFRRASFGLLVVAVLFLLPQIARADGVHKGKVLNAGEGKISILDQDDETETFAVAKDAKITRNGKAASLDDIEDGDMVKVTTKKVDGKETAVAIEAKAKE